MKADRYNETMGIDLNSSAKGNVRVLRQGRSLQVAAPEGSRIQVYNLAGQLIGEGNGCLLPSTPVIVRIACGNDITVKKV